MLSLLAVRGWIKTLWLLLPVWGLVAVAAILGADVLQMLLRLKEHPQEWLVLEKVRGVWVFIARMCLCVGNKEI